MSSARLHYTFGPLERRGILGPIRLGQAVGLSLATVIAILAIDLSPALPGVVISTAAVTAGAVGVFAPLAGRSPQEWLPILATFAWRRISGRARFASPIPGRGMRVRWRVDGRGIALGDPLPVTPPELHGVGVIEAAYRQRPIGALTERSGRRLTAVLACRAAAFSLLDPEAQERRLARWGLVLSGAASSAVKRIQWIERTAPAQGDELARWVHAERDPSVPLRGTPLIDSYLELIGTTASVTQDHEILLAVQIDARSVRGDGEAAIRTLIEESERIAQSLEAAEVTVLGALTAGQLARALRTAFDPYARAELTALETADPERDGLDGANAWPLGARESWDHYQTDGALHATYWIGAWPRVEVSPMFMAALLGRSSIVRTVAVTFEPIAPGRSTREVEAAITQDQADRELRRRFGQSETARQRQAREATVRRESELAAGHGEVRFTGFVTVSGRDVDELRQAGAELAEHAARARLELHRMYGQQAEAFTFTLPLCRGLL